MKQLSSRILAICLSLTLVASAIVGAMSVSVLPAEAAVPLSDGYLDDLLAEAILDCPPTGLTQFNQVAQQLKDHFDEWLIVVEHYEGSHDWYFASYVPKANLTLRYWHFTYDYNYFRPRYNEDYYDYEFTGGYGFHIYNNQIWFESQIGLANTMFNQYDIFNYSGWIWHVPDIDDIDSSSRICYSNQNIRWSNGGSWRPDETYVIILYANLLPGSFTPPIIDFSYFKFNLGDRWYLTTYDQSLVSNMERGDDTFWVWVLRLLPNDGSTDLDPKVLSFSKMVYLPGAENFLSQNVTNVSSRGILAYDITDLILSGDYVCVFESFFSIAYDASPDPDFLPVAFSDTIVDLYLEPDQENQSINESWTTINNYVINYPSVTVAPEQLAEQLFGDNAYTGFMGDIRIPYSLGVNFNLFGQDVNLCDAYFHYWLYQSGLGADENSILNFDLFNACVIAAPQVNRNVYVAYWNSDDDQLIRFNYVGLMDTQDLLDTYDLLLVAPADSEWLEDPSHFPVTVPGSSVAYTNLNQESPLTPRGVEGVYPVYIIVSHKAITKSQLFVFCDGFNKLYNLATQFCNKRDLWDSSFFEWSMSVFWELQSIDGHLNSIEFIIQSWDLGNKLSDIVDSLNRIADNTDELQEPMWYESLWNWVRQFTPSDSAFLTGLNAIDDGFDNIPLLPVPTNYPDYPLLPTFTPTPVPDPGGE